MIVIADHQQIVRDSTTNALEFADSPNRHLVVGKEDRVTIWQIWCQIMHRAGTRLFSMVPFELQARISLKTSLAQRDSITVSFVQR